MKHSPKKPLLDRVAEALDIPTDRASGDLRLDLRGRRALTVHGCRRIEDFSPTLIRLALADGSLTVRGCDLLCTSYLAGAVGIEGRICCLQFDDGEGNA